MRIPTSPRTDSVNLDAADDARLLGLGEAMAAVGGLGHTSWLCYRQTDGRTGRPDGATGRNSEDDTAAATSAPPLAEQE